VRSLTGLLVCCLVATSLAPLRYGAQGSKGFAQILDGGYPRTFDRRSVLCLLGTHWHTHMGIARSRKVLKLPGAGRPFAAIPQSNLVHPHSADPQQDAQLLSSSRDKHSDGRPCAIIPATAPSLFRPSEYGRQAVQPTSNDSVKRLIRWMFLSIFLAAVSEYAGAKQGKISEETRQQLEAAVSGFMAASKAPGVSAAVVENGQEVWSGGFGMADLENLVPATPKTLFRLGSVSKPITSTAAMELWEQGKIDLDAPVQNYCSAFPTKPWPVTTRELLGHLGGIRHYRVAEGTAQLRDDPEIGNTKHFDDPISGGLTFFAGDPLVAQPGTKFHYSTQGYTLVGCAIEGASGEKYVDFVRESVFERANMNDTQSDDPYKIVPHRTRFYQKDKSGAVLNADFLDSSYKIPGGGWLSSADDLAQFETALLNDRLMKRQTRDLMWTPQKTTDGKATRYALGWFTSQIGDRAMVEHTGGQQGTSTVIIIAPEQNDGVVVLINLEDVDAGALGTALIKIVLGIPTANSTN
jgi:serine beta-lactamase-like protein LACTB, mitochondrial